MSDNSVDPREEQPTKQAVEQVVGGASEVLSTKDSEKLASEKLASEKLASEKLAAERMALEKSFGELAPLARVVLLATSVIDEETQMVASRSPLSALRAVAQQKEALLTQHDLQILRLQGKGDNKGDDKGDDKGVDLSGFVSTLNQETRSRLRALYARFEEALRKNGLRLKAALASSEMLLAALSDAAEDDSVKGPQMYTPQGRLSETGRSVSFSRSVASHSEA